MRRKKPYYNPPKSVFGPKVHQNPDKIFVSPDKIFVSSQNLDFVLGKMFQNKMARTDGKLEQPDNTITAYVDERGVQSVENIAVPHVLERQWQGFRHGLGGVYDLVKCPELHDTIGDHKDHKSYKSIHEVETIKIKL